MYSYNGYACKYKSFFKKLLQFSFFFSNSWGQIDLWKFMNLCQNWRRSKVGYFILEIHTAVYSEKTVENPTKFQKIKKNLNPNRNPTIPYNISIIWYYDMCILVYVHQ